MNIIGLHVENIKRIKVVSITPKGNVVLIGGKNGNGKSSTLDAIAMAIGGGKLIPDRPVRDGEEQAKIVVDMGDYIATRHWTTPDKSYLKLETKEGAKIGNAQAMLDKIVGNLAFDPLEFATLEPAKRFEILKKITGLDFAALDAEYKVNFESRRDIGRLGESTKAQLEQFKDLKEIPEPAGIEQIKADKAKLEAENKVIADAKSSAAMKQSVLDSVESQIEDTLKRIESLKLEVAGLETRKATAQKEKQAFVDVANGEVHDLSKFDKAMEDFYAYQANLKQVEQKKSIEGQIEKYRLEWSKFDDKLKQIIASKEKQLAEAKMPVEGLSIGEKEVLFKNIPFAQLSTAEQINVSFAMAMSMNPKLKVAIIKNGSLLDSDAMEALTKLAVDNDYQVWVEKVASGPEAGMVLIEDGEVKE